MDGLLVGWIDGRCVEAETGWGVGTCASFSSLTEGRGHTNGHRHIQWRKFLVNVVDKVGAPEAKTTTVNARVETAIKQVSEGRGRARRWI
jgi:hypothetical protein